MDVSAELRASIHRTKRTLLPLINCQVYSRKCIDVNLGGATLFPCRLFLPSPLYGASSQCDSLGKRGDVWGRAPAWIEFGAWRGRFGDIRRKKLSTECKI